MQPGISQVKHIIAVHSAKGGVGKSTLTLNLAVAMARGGAKVGLMDADIHGPSMSLMLGNDGMPELLDGPQKAIRPMQAHGIVYMSMGNLVTEKTPLIWRGAMVHGVIGQFISEVAWGSLDYLLIDMPPGTGDALLSLGQSTPLSGALIITTPQALSLTDTVRGIHALRQLKVPILGIVENMAYFVCDGCEDRVFLFGEGGGAAMASELKLPLLGQIPLEAGVSAAGDSGNPMVLAHPESAPALAVTEVAKALIEKAESGDGKAQIQLKWRKLGFGERFPQPPEQHMDPRLGLKAVWQISTDELGIQWEDSHISTYGVRALRLACPCAACIDEWTGEKRLKPDQVPGEITLTAVESVGRYALNLQFSDGHKSGIYRLTRLRDMDTAKAT